MTENIIRQRLIFRGQVQGVGFRYRSKHAAEHLRVTGWVKNEWDGRVTMEAQGTLEQIDEMIRLIRRSPYIQIDWIDRREIPVEVHDTGFHVR